MPAKKKNPTEKKAKPKRQPAFSPFFIGFVIVFLLLAGWGFWHQFQRLDEIGNYKACLDIEKDPSLTYQCTCRPKALNTSEGYEYVYEKSTAFCICKCQISANETQTFEIRRAKPGTPTTGYQQLPNLQN